MRKVYGWPETRTAVINITETGLTSVTSRRTWVNPRLLTTGKIIDVEAGGGWGGFIPRRMICEIAASGVGEVLLKRLGRTRPRRQKQFEFADPGISRNVVGLLASASAWKSMRDTDFK